MSYKKHNAEVLERLASNPEEFRVQNSDELLVPLATKSDTEMLVKVTNSTGYDQNISTLSAVKAEVVDQIVYGKNISDFAMITSYSGYSDSLTYFTVEAVASPEGSSSSDGVNAQGQNVDYVTNKVVVGIDEYTAGYSVGHTELQQAQMTTNRSALVSKERAEESKRKVYMQEKFFIGKHGLKGLLNMANVSTDATTLPVDISAMSQEQLNTVASDMVEAWKENCFYTSTPDTLCVSEQELVKFSKIYSEFNIATVTEMLRKAFAEATQNPNFKIVATLYAAAANQEDGKNLYMLYNSQVVFHDIPVDVEVMYSLGLNVRAEKLVRSSEVYAERPQEVLYFKPVA